MEPERLPPPGSGRRRGRPAFSLIELLCVLGIIGILLSLLLPAVFGAFTKAKRTLFGIQEPAYVDLIQSKYTPYRLSNPAHPTLDRDAFIREVQLDDRVARWLRSPAVTYHPFSGASAPDFVVIEHRVRTAEGTNVSLYPVMALLRVETE